MKVLSEQNVFDAALDRIRFLFDEFPDVIVAFSGGKDSTVCLELSLIVAREKNRLPLRVLWIDQEAEYQATVDYTKDVMYRDEVLPMWMQMPIVIFNATSPTEQWLEVWKPGAKWMREKDDISIKENIYQTDRFHKLFTNILAYHFPRKPACIIGGVRSQESPSRHGSLTNQATYKWVTWGAIQNKAWNQFTFYPIYDWTYNDVWKAIYSNHWDYNKMYDFFYQHNVPIQNMRISNLHHETALHHLYMLQELEPGTWNNLTERLQGINTAGMNKKEFFTAPTTLPFMFESWYEYKEYLLENLIGDPGDRETYRARFDQFEKHYSHGNSLVNESLYKEMVRTICANDITMTKFKNWTANPNIAGWLKWKVHGILPNHKNPYISYERRIETYPE